MRTKIFIPTLVILIYYSILGSCQKTESLASSNLKGLWSLSAISDSVSSGHFPTAYPIKMRIVTDTIYVSSPVNGYFAAYHIHNNDGMTIKSIVGTMVFTAYYGEWETRFINLLQKTVSFKQSKDTLTFISSNPSYNLKFNKNP